MPVVSITLVVVDDTVPVANPLPTTVVRIYTEDGVTLITEGTTDEDGEVAFLLDDLTNYWVRFFKWEHAFDNRLRIEVDGDAHYTVIGRDLAWHPGSAVPELCRASGYIVNASGQPAGGAAFRFDATRLPDVVAGRGIVSSSVTVFSQPDGYVEVELVRGGVYDVMVSGHEDKTYRVKVPDAEAVNITDLVWPYVVSFTYDVDSVHLSVGETIEIQPSVLLSSKVFTPYNLDGNERVYFSFYIEVTQADSGIVTLLRKIPEDKVILTGMAPGAVTLRATLVPDKEALRLPEPVRVLQQLVIIVT